MDRRKRKTRKQIFDSLVLLMQERPLKDISVCMLTEKADINRGTFYLHFTDIYDLSDALKEQVRQDLDDMLRKADMDIVRGGSLPVMKQIVLYAYDNQNLCRAIFGPFGDAGFLLQIKAMIRNRLQPLWEEIRRSTGTSTLDYDYFFAFTSSGIIGILQEWIQKDFASPPNEIMEKAETILYCGIQWLLGEGDIKKR